MDEQALNDAYNLFTRQGYNGTIDQFKKLISTNSQALNDSYQIFRSKGYNGEIDNYKELIGLKKKESSTPDSQVGMEDLQDGFDFSPTIFEAPSVLTPKKQKEYIAEQKAKPAPIPAPETTQPSITPTETLTVGSMGITGLQRTKDYKPAEEFKGKSAAYISGELLKTLGKGVVKFPADALETIAIGASAIDNLIAKTGLTEKTEASKLATYEAAQEYRKLIDEVIPTDKDIENGFWGQSANALGQMVPIILSGFTAGGAKAIATQAAKKGVKLQSIINYGKNLASRMATPQGGLTISQVAAPSYSQAKSEGATENEALTYAGLNALLSYPIEMLPVDGLFKRLDKALVGNKGVEILKRGVIGGSQEGITEGIQNVYENLSANQIYGTTKDFLEGTGNASAVGGTVGLITNALLTALLGRRARATTNEEIVELDKSIEDTKKKVEQINSNNERFIETINTLEQSKPRTLNYGSAEYNFIESPEGNLELAQDDITKEQAEGIIKNLSGTYKKIEFSIQEIEPEDLYQPTTYRVIGTPIKTETTVEAPEVTQTRIDRIAEIETTITNDDADLIILLPAERVKLQTELETLKSEQDAIQIQTAGQVPVLTEAGVGEEVPQGLTQTESEVVTEEGVQEVAPTQPKQEVTITTLNPTGTIFTEYTPEDRDRLPLGENITTYDVTAGVNPTEKVTVYRGVPNDINEIKSGDFVTTNKQLATDYAGTGKVISMEVNANEILDDKTEPLGEEYILRIPQAKVSLQTQTPKFVRDISALITPATVRAFSPLTKRIQKLSLNYNKLVRQYAKKKDPKVLEKIKNAEAQILNDAKQEIIDAVAKVDGVAVKFNDIKRGLWNKKFEPSFNMILSISPQADTKKLSDLLFDFAEKYSQDSFILETDSELHDEWVNGNINMPLSEKDSNGLTNYPQIIYTFAEPITDEQLSDLSVALEKEGVAAFNINNNELKVSVFFTEDQDINLTKDEQYEERKKDYESRLESTETAVFSVFGSNANGSLDIRIKKSNYQGAVNEGSPVQTRQYDRSDILKAFKESTTKVEVLAVELAGLRQKEISLQDKGKKLSPKDKARFDELIKIVQPVVQRTFEANKKLYEDAKTEVEGIAQDAITQVDASISPFPIKRAERASVKAIRWYNAFTEKLGDGSRVNIVVDTDANADEVFKIINEKYPRTDERRIKETTTLGYPKRLIEIITSNGTIAEIQVITNEAYLAKDGIKGFTGNEQQKTTATQKLDAVRARLGWSIPDGLGHYFYEIQRDTNVDDNLRNEAARLSDLYYDAFTNPQSKLSESFMRDVMSFKEQVDAADKSEWDTGNEGIAPQSLVDYKTSDVVTEEKQFVPLTADDIEFDKRFSRDEASDVVEGERENENGRVSIYMAEVETPVFDADGEQIGYLVKMVDDDKNLSFEARNDNGSNLSKNEEGFETLREAEKALLDNYNKQKKKEFDREAKVEAKKLAKKSAKAEAKKPVEAIDALLDLDVTNQDNLDRIFNALDNADKFLDKAFKGGAFELSILAIPIGVVRGTVKIIKRLVKGGMLLRDAIKKAAADKNISQESIKDILNIAPIQDSFYALMDNIDALIARQKARGIDNKKITSNVDTFIRKQDEYLNANDAQKKIIEREARAKMGAAPKRAVSIGRVLGALKDITNISRAEKLKIISQIRKLSKDAAKDLAKEIRAMASSGKITQVQSANIIARFGKVNMLNEVSVSNFVDYMAKVFANAEYANKIDVAKSKLKNARQNIATKIGIADGIVGPLQRLFSINPALIPNLYLDRYLDLVNMFSARQAVLTLEDKSVVKSDTEAILREIDAEQSKADELADRFSNSENKVFKDNVLDYAASIRKMLEEDEIDQNEADIMRKYKSDIAPQVEKSKMTEEELAEEKDELLEALDSIEIDASGLPTKEERNLANRLKDLLSTNAIYKLSNVELKNLLKVLDNINNNYLPHYAQLMVEKLTAINNAKTLTSAIKKSVIAPLSGLYSRVKSFVLMSKRTAISEMIRRNPLFNIGEVFGDFKTKDIFNAVLNKVSEGESRFKTDLKRIQNILEKAEERVAKSFKLNANDTLMSKFKMMTYMVQLEYDSNQGSKQVNPAAEYLKATIKHIDEGKSQFGERDANMLQSILKKFETDGKIDNEKLYKSFNEAEKSAIKVIRGVNESLREKAEYTAAIIRGDRINPLTNYVHLNVLHEHKPNDLTSGVAFVNDYNNAMRPSTKAKSLIERTGKVSPLNFDIFASAQRGAKFVLMDYNLTEPIRTARKTIKQTIANFEEEGRVPKEKRQIINAIDSAFEEATENVLTNTFVTNSLADDVIDYIKKQGYRTVLAGTGRFISELTSNIGFAVIIDPKAFTTGIENRGFIMSVDAPLVMENVGSKQTNRVFPTDTLSGKLIDTNILQQASGIKGAKSKNPVANKIQQIWNLSGKKYVNAVELTADALISTPDKLIMRPMWFGSFANEFQKLTGEKVNFEKIAANDENYMEQYKSAIEKAKTIADEKSVMTGSTDNAFMGILKGTIKPDQSVTTRIFNNFNNFMTKFLIFEYITARAGINAAMGNGSLTKKQGVAVLGAVATRMVVYTLLTQMLGSGLIGLFFDDDEEETEKSFMQKLGQSITSAFTSLVFGRDFGNATKTIINYGLERANEKYLDFLREGEYDPYKDAIQYSIIPREKKGSITDISDLLLNVAGPLGPALKTGDLVIRKAFEPEKKESDAIQRQQDEINVRIPLEVLGNAGFIPLYKDIRKAVLKEMYSSLENPKKVINEKQEEVNQKVEALEKIKTNTKNKNVYNAIDEKINELQAGAEEKKNIKEENAEEKQRKEELLTNPVTGEKYDNESELKRYNKRLYNKNFGVRSEWYKEHRYEELVQKKMNLQIRKMEDRENRYRAPVKKTAKKRNSDGSFKRVSSR